MIKIKGGVRVYSCKVIESIEFECIYMKSALMSRKNNIFDFVPMLVLLHVNLIFPVFSSCTYLELGFSVFIPFSVCVCV